MFDGVWCLEYETQRRSWSFNVLMFCRQLDFRHNINKHYFLQYPIRTASNIAYMSVQMWIYRITKWPVPYLHVNGDCKDVKRMPLPHWHDTGIAKILPSVMNICSSATQAWNGARCRVQVWTCHGWMWRYADMWLTILTPVLDTRHIMFTA